MSNPIILTRGVPATEDPAVDYVPAVSIDHDETRSELHVIVGEEAAGMAEGVDGAAWADICARIARLERLEKILAAVGEGGSLVIRCEPGFGPDWSLLSALGSEAPDSDMAGGSHVGAGETLDECLESAVR